MLFRKKSHKKFKSFLRKYWLKRRECFFSLIYKFEILNQQEENYYGKKIEILNFCFLILDIYFIIQSIKN
jgi:hypothetical protein